MAEVTIPPSRFRAQTKVPISELQRLLTYDPMTGKIRWRTARSTNIKPGMLAGYVNKSAGNGYVKIEINGVGFYAHRIAWALMTGVWPQEEIDHISLDRTDNRWENLREATHGQNQANSKTPKNNKSGVKGVYWSSTSWRIEINIDGKRFSKRFADKDEAIRERLRLASEAHGSFFRAK